MRVAPERAGAQPHVVRVPLRYLHRGVLGRPVVHDDDLVGDLVDGLERAVERRLAVVRYHADGQSLPRALQEELALPVYLAERLAVVLVENHEPPGERAVVVQLLEVGEGHDMEAVAVPEYVHQVVLVERADVDGHDALGDELVALPMAVRCGETHPAAGLAVALKLFCHLLGVGQVFEDLHGDDEVELSRAINTVP